MILSVELRKRLLTVLQLRGMAGDWLRVAESAINTVLPEIQKIIKEEIEKARKQWHSTS